MELGLNPQLRNYQASKSYDTELVPQPYFYKRIYFFFILWLCVSACMYVYVTHTSLVPEGTRRERWMLWLAYKHMDFIRTHTCETILRHLSPPQLLGNLLPLSNRPSFSFHDTGSPLPSLVLPFSLYSPYAPLYFHARCRFICVYVCK